jgi:phosphocarrier protein
MTEPAEKTVEIVNRLGLHARAAARLVTLAAKYQADVRISKDGRTVSGKSIMGVMMLAAAQGSRLTLSATGDDAIEALEALAALIARRFDEES